MSCSPADLLRFTMITSGAMTTCLDRLEAAGMITRRMSETDRRARVISLTEKGMGVIEDALFERYEAAASSFADLSKEELVALNAVLRRVRTKKGLKFSKAEKSVLPCPYRAGARAQLFHHFLGKRGQCGSLWRPVPSLVP